MPDFICRLADNSGKTTNATYNSVSELELRQRLEGQGFLVYSIKKKAKTVSFLLPFFSGRRKIKSRDFIIFNQQFVALVGSGLPILKALELLAKREKEEQLQVILRNVTEQVKAGSLLSEAFENQGSFSKVYTASVYAGEKSGNLEQVLQRFIQYQKTINTTRSKIKSALTYPLILASLLVILVSYLMAVVVPQFAQFYAGMDTNLPSITQFLIVVSQSIHNQFFTGIIVIGVLLASLSMWVRGNRGRAYFDKLKLRFPIVGDVWQKFLFDQNLLPVDEFAKKMLKNKFGRIVNITSIVGHTGNTGQANYAASKAGIIAMSKSLATEYAKKNITVNCVSPGFIVSDMTMNIAEKVKLYLTSRIPMGKLGTGEDVSNSVAFLSSDQASYITGETIHVNGGMYMA